MYAWGDNDHGQQGNTSTSVNRKPALVTGLEEYKISRAACGSSHSIAWCTMDTTAPTSHEPVPFSAARDPLGSAVMAEGEHMLDDVMSASATASDRNSLDRPSLSKIVMSQETAHAKQQALQKILTALHIIYARFDCDISSHYGLTGCSRLHGACCVCREAIVSSLVRDSVHVNLNSEATTMQASALTQSELSPMPSLETSTHSAAGARAGSTAGATLEETAAELAAASGSQLRATESVQHVIPSSVDAIASYHSLAKASPASSIIAETFTTTEQVTSADGDTLVPAPDLDEFTTTLSSDDARLLVDLLKLAVAGRAGEHGKDSIAHVLMALGKANEQVTRYKN